MGSWITRKTMIRSLQFLVVHLNLLRREKAEDGVKDGSCLRDEASIRFQKYGVWRTELMNTWRCWARHPHTGHGSSAPLHTFPALHISATWMFVGIL